MAITNHERWADKCFETDPRLVYYSSLQQEPVNHNTFASIDFAAVYCRALNSMGKYLIWWLW